MHLIPGGVYPSLLGAAGGGDFSFGPLRAPGGRARPSVNRRRGSRVPHGSASCGVIAAALDGPPFAKCESRTCRANILRGRILPARGRIFDPPALKRCMHINLPIICNNTAMLPRCMAGASGRLALSADLFRGDMLPAGLSLRSD